MWAKALLILAVCPALITCQRPSIDYDYSEEPSAFGQQASFPAPQAQPARRALQAQPALQAQSAIPSRSAPPQAASAPNKGRAPSAQSGSRDPQEQKPEQIEILQQINEHNDDGSYTYGYEGSDGSFKLETRFPDGRVQGRYGYLDIETGKLKVIEYGADAMGFQPVGDLPEGIVVPPPVIGSDTQEHDGQAEDFNNGQFIPLPQPTVHNRARQESGQRSIQGNPSQNRGQDFEQHPSTATRTRTPQLVVEQPFEEAQPPRRPEPEAESFTRFQPQQEPFQPAPQQNRPQQGQAPASFQAFQPVPAPAAPRPQPQAPAFQAFEANSAPQQSFTQETRFEGRPAQPLNSFPATAAPANFQPTPAHFQAAPARPEPTPPNFQAAPARPEQVPVRPEQAVPAGFQSVPATPQAQFQQQQSQFANFQSNERFPKQDFPEVARSDSENFRQTEEQNAPASEAPPAVQFNPNRARGNVRQQQARPAPAAFRPQEQEARPAPASFRPQEQEQQAPVPAPVRAPVRLEQQAPVRAPARPQQPEQSAAPAPVRSLIRPQQQEQEQPVRSAPASRQPLSRGQHITPPRDQEQNFRPSQDSDGEQFHAPIESSGPPPRFESFPIQGSEPSPSQNRFQAAPAQASFQQQPEPKREPAPESFRPEEEPAPVRIRARPQEAAPQPQAAAPQPQQNFQFQQQFQQPQKPQQFQQPQQPQQNFQSQNFQQFQQSQPSQQNFPSAVNFDNLVQEFTVQNRNGRSEQDFQQIVLDQPRPQPVQQVFPQQGFRFNPVPAVPTA